MAVGFDLLSIDIGFTARLSALITPQQERTPFRKNPWRRFNRSASAKNNICSVAELDYGHRGFEVGELETAANEKLGGPLERILSSSHVSAGAGKSKVVGCLYRNQINSFSRIYCARKSLIAG